MTEYTDVTIGEAEWARIGFATCKHCGAAILLDPRDDANPQELHDKWHYIEAHR